MVQLYFSLRFDHPSFSSLLVLTFVVFLFCQVIEISGPGPWEAEEEAEEEEEEEEEERKESILRTSISRNVNSTSIAPASFSPLISLQEQIESAFQQL